MAKTSADAAMGGRAASRSTGPMAICAARGDRGRHHPPRHRPLSRPHDRSRAPPRDRPLDPLSQARRPRDRHRRLSSHSGPMRRLASTAAAPRRLPERATAGPSPPPKSACSQRMFDGAASPSAIPAKAASSSSLPARGEPVVRQFAELERASDPRRAVAFAMNAGMYDEDGRPIGLTIVEGRRSRDQPAPRRRQFPPDAQRRLPGARGRPRRGRHQRRNGGHRPTSASPPSPARCW